jgi:uncharacterized protein
VTWVWVDFENTPHVLFLEPIVARLRAHGWTVRVSAKPQAQTIALAAARGIPVDPVGTGDLAGRSEKILGGLGRAARLWRWAGRPQRPAVLICSSRTAAMAAFALRVPVVGLLDYEHAEHRPLTFASRHVWLPDILQSAPLPRALRRVARYYPGLKENLYLDSLSLNRETERHRAGVDAETTLVVTRPPATTAHYASRENYGFWLQVMRAVGSWPDAKIVIVPRTTSQAARAAFDLATVARAEVLRDIVSGPNLIAAADLVIGGGGTMNREAAVLGVPVWSVFTGPTPAIDDQLAREGRLRWVRHPSDLAGALDEGIPPRRPARGPFPAGLSAIITDIEDLLAGHS